MKVLSIETATAVCAVAIVEDSRVLAEQSHEQERSHSENLVLMIEKLLSESRISLGSIGGIAISIGPGSFTGLRIGLSVAKGLAFAAGIPLTAVSTLEALARNCIVNDLAHGDELIVSLIDARRDELFAAVFRTEEAKLRCEVSPRALIAAELYNLLDAQQKIIFVGNGTEKFQKHLMTIENSDRFVIPLRGHRICSAASVGLIGAEQFARGETAEVATLEPLYIKPFFTLMKPLPEVNR